MTVCSKVPGSTAAVNQTVPAAPQRGNGGKPDLSPELLRELLDYDPETGVLTWKPRPASMFEGGKYSTGRLAASWNSKHAGRPAFATDSGHGYRHGLIFGARHYAHRVAWAIYHGCWPGGQIDHISGDCSDNRIANLRDVSHGENMRNQKSRSTNASGAIGVCWNSQRGKWQAYISVDGHHQHLGYFTEFEDATAARKAAEREFGFHENHGRKG